jgi:hypothetical protein
MSRGDEAWGVDARRRGSWVNRTFGAMGNSVFDRCRLR